MKLMTNFTAYFSEIKLKNLKNSCVLQCLNANFLSILYNFEVFRDMLPRSRYAYIIYLQSK